MPNLEAGRSDEKKFGTPTSRGLCIISQSTANSSVKHPSSYHFRTPTHVETNTFFQQRPPYMAPTISSAMKMKQIMKQCTSLRSPLMTSRGRHSIPKGLYTATLFTPSRKRKSQSRLRLRQQAISQSLPKLCRKVNRLPESELLTTECNIANALNHQNLRRTPPSQPLFRVARCSAHCGGLYHNYLKQLYWDRITSKYDKVSRNGKLTKEPKQQTADLSSIDIQNTQTEMYLEEAQLQLSSKNSYQEETSQPDFGRDYLQQADIVTSTSTLRTAQAKTPRGWQRKLLRVPWKISRFDRFASQSEFLEAVSAQVWITEAPLRHSRYYASKTARYDIWQRISSNSSQKVSRLKRFRESEIENTKSRCISELEQSADQFILTESRMFRGSIWRQTISKSLPKISRLDRFPVPDNSVVDISHGNLRSEQFEREVSLNFLATQSSPSSASRSPAILSNSSQRGSSCEQAKLMPLREVSSMSNLSCLHTTQLQSSKMFLTESLSSKESSKKHPKLTIKPSCRATSLERFEKNLASNLPVSETRSLVASVLSDVVFYDKYLWKRSKPILQRTSRSQRFQKRTLSSSSTISTESFEKSIVSKALFSQVSARKESKISRFSRFQKNTLSILSTVSSFISVFSNTTSSQRSLIKELKSILSRKFSRQNYVLPPRYLASSSRLMAERTQKNSRVECFRKSASLDLRAARIRSSSPSLFSEISLTSSSGRCLCMQTRVVPPKKSHRYRPDFQENTMYTFDFCQQEKILGRELQISRDNKASNVL